MGSYLIHKENFMPANVQTMFSGRGVTPWHKLGTIVEGTPTSEEAIKLAGLDWTVEKHPIFARIPREPGTMVEGAGTGKMKRVDSLFATVRSDNEHPLGVVGARYVPIQNREVFGVLDSLVSEGAAQYETAGALDNGETVWMLLVAEALKVAGDEIRPYFLARTTHDGSGLLDLRNVSTRVVCANTLAAAMGEKVSRRLTIRHTSGAKQQMSEAAKALGLVRETQTAFVAEADQLLAQPYSRANFEKLVATIMPPPDVSDPNFTDRQGKSWQQRFEQIMQAYKAPDLENVRDTAWGALNAVADFEQHMQRTKGDDQAQMETLFKRSFLAPALTAAARAVLVS